jgi:hypothetical protein
MVFVEPCLLNFVTLSFNVTSLKKAAPFPIFIVSLEGPFLVIENLFIKTT